LGIMTLTFGMVSLAAHIKVCKGTAFLRDMQIKKEKSS